MRSLLGFFLALVLFGVQVSLWPDLTDRIMPAWLLALAMAWGFQAGKVAGFRLAFAFGLLLDLYAQHNFGMFTVAMTAAYGVVLIASRNEEEGLGARLGVAVIGAFVYELVILIVLRLSESNFPFFANLLRVSTLNVVGTVLAFLLLSGLVSLYLSRIGPPHEQRPVRI